MKPDTQLLDRVLGIAREAGAAIMAIYRRETIQMAQKADHSPLTEADLASHGIIVAGLSALAPHIPILSEEDAPGFSGPNVEGRYWLVDPLDGTKEFLSRNGEFTVNIALVEHGRPILGVVTAPALGSEYYAAQGLGAFKRDKDGSVSSLNVAPHPLGATWRVVGSRSHAGDTLLAWLAELGPHELVPMGSSLKFCLVAEGRADLYPRFGPTHYWDTAAAQCIVEQAGGRVRDLSTTILAYPWSGHTLNPSFIAGAP